MSTADDSREPSPLRSEGDSLGPAVEQLDELCRELAARPGLTPTRPGAERAAQRGHDERPDQQTDGEHNARGRAKSVSDPNRKGASEERYQGRAEAAQIEVLERVYIADHAREQVALAVVIELGGGEWFDSFEEPHAYPAQHA